MLMYSLTIPLITLINFHIAEEAAPGFSGHTLQTFTVERLRALLRQRGLMTKGKKASKNCRSKFSCSKFKWFHAFNSVTSICI